VRLLLLIQDRRPAGTVEIVVLAALGARRSLLIEIKAFFDCRGQLASRFPGSRSMPIETAVVVIMIALAFLIFAGTLGWASRGRDSLKSTAS
jgi:hypothetical protein